MSNKRQGKRANNAQVTSESLIKGLAQDLKERFDIEISVLKMINDEQYRHTVVNELRSIEEESLSSQLDAINQQFISETSAEKSTAITTHNKYLIPWLIFLSILILSLTIKISLFPAENSTPKTIEVSQPASEVPEYIQTEVQTAPVTTKLATNMLAPSKPSASLPSASLPSDNVEVLFRLHGSNTIGEKLGPALLEAFFKEQGVDEFYWQEGKSKVERTLQFIQNNKVKAVQLHAHGSGTAFKDMISGAADVGMASRRIKEKELKATKSTLGDLSRVGSEHIIGLDGLAIIVNQNSPYKSMSMQTLAKIYSGEVTKWQQLGLGEGDISVFARDKNSGTWDTFNKLVLKKADKKITDKAQRLESSSDLSLMVSQNERAIGFIGLNYIGHNKALAITEGKGTIPIIPTKFTISTEDYALSRRLYLYTPTAANALVKDFAQFAISEKGQELVDSVGLISQNIELQKVYASTGAPKSYNNYVEKAQRLSLNFRFNHGNGQLDNKGQRDMFRLVDFIEKNPGRRIVLMGFSDSSGGKSANRQLSYRRAKSVEKELTSRGIPIMAVEAYGELLPVANNNTHAGRERNRRVEVWII